MNITPRHVYGHMRSDSVLHLVVVGVVGVAVVAFVGGGAAAPNAAGSTLGSATSVSEYDTIVVRIDLAPNGTAHWHVEFRYELRDGASERAFEQATANVTNPPGEFIGRMQDGPVAQAERKTGRTMAVRNGEVEAVTGVGVGKVIYTFQWTNFAATPGENRYVVGDAISGLPFGENTQLWIEWPERFRRESVSPEPDATRENAFRWDAPETLRPSDPTVELVADTETRPSGLPVIPAVGAAALLLAAGVGWYGRTRWRGEEAEPEPEATPADELLSDEERVLQLLEEREGRMKQQDLNDTVEWSRTKTSDVVNRMHESEQIEVFRLGRENVLALPGEIEI